MDKKSRVNQAYSYLYDIGAIHSQKELSEKMGASAPNVSSALKGVESVLTDRFLNRFSDTFPIINKAWLLTGEGEMLNSAQPSVAATSVPNPSSFSFPRKTSDKGCGVPYYNVDFIGGFDLVLNDQTVVPEYYIDFKKYNSADCWCNVTGHSMEPEINPGDIIALKELEDWRTYMPAGEIYGIVTTEHRTIKKVRPSDREGYIRLIPINRSPEYTEQDIPISIIIKVYKVLGCVKRL